ncbi:Methyltransferase domain-containing protein [Nitrosospira sp. Nsp18]|uniref:class I SAM-dependent methyltransferase n=1 Tax=Nitrosospira sp. Nsp18 TaxID=1855334 RepID=UPI0008874340|nr:class I SAM-dependent methyltransferase [Nitrosospira sp. Nsp18]SDA21882.1 Methyltransferase domain-containing protein [Nitrosospira sp. Nsp18]
MVSNKSPYLKFNHDEYARSQSPDNFWGQIRRTVQGRPVTDDQINMIVEAIKTGLDIRSDDVLLDLACGNGALPHLFFDSCAEYLGVDFSEYLISVAKKNFERFPNITFTLQGVAKYVCLESRPDRFTKALCYGSFSYFPEADAIEVLRLLFEKFSNIQKLFIGNLPDKDQMAKFYTTRTPDQYELSDPCSQIGIWRSRDEFARLAANAGWNVKFLSMPLEFYAAHYRYDALLSRNSEK